MEPIRERQLEISDVPFSVSFSVSGGLLKTEKRKLNTLVGLLFPAVGVGWRLSGLAVPGDSAGMTQFGWAFPNCVLCPRDSPRNSPGSFGT